MKIDEQKIEALKSIKDANLMISLIKDYIQDNPEMASKLLDELGQNLEKFGGLDINSLEKIKGVDGKTPVFGVDYFTEKEIEGINNFVLKSVENNLPKKNIDYPSTKSLTDFITQKILNLNLKNGKDGKDVTKKDIEDVVKKYKNELKGKDGSPDNPLEIIEKIKRVRGSKKLGLNNINGLPAVVKQVRENKQNIEDIDEKIKNQVISYGNSEEGAVDLSDYDTKTEVDTKITTATDSLLNGAGPAYDTLKEIAGEIQNNDLDIATILTNQGNKVDKVTGKSLIADTEITRLAGVDENAEENIQSD
jgi:hypothetical protein